MKRKKYKQNLKKKRKINKKKWILEDMEIIIKINSKNKKKKKNKKLIQN